MTYKIRDIEVHFPFEPYEVQKRFMEKVIDCLDGSFEGEKYEFCTSNGLLESPTGTGKTLSILCSSLAWLNHHKERLAEEGINPLPRIVFATRTHSQIRQVVSEIKGTAYEPKVCVLSSRKQLCINPPKSGSSNDDIRMSCLEKVRSRKCQYYHPSFEDSKYRYGNFQEIPPVDGIMDIEELCNLGRRETYCPYYYQRKIALKDCEFILLPYNYLVNPGIKKSIQLSLSNSVLIFDEAHNLEKVCESLSSFYFDSSMFVNSIKELDVLINVKYREGRLNIYLRAVKLKITKLREMIIELEQQIIRDFFRRSDPTKHVRQERVLILRGSFLARMFSEFLDLNHGDQEGVKSVMRLIYECKRDLRQMKPEEAEGCKHSPGLTSFRNVLNQFFSFTTLNKVKMKKYFRLIMIQKPPGFKKNFAPKETKRYIKEYEDFEPFKERVPFFTYEYFCLSPSIAMYELLYSKISIKNYDAMKWARKIKRRKVMKDEDEEEEEEREEEGERLIDPNEYDGGELPPKAVILISGTLSPLPFFEKSFEIPFPIRLLNKHTIKRSQLSALICTTGPSKVHLTSEFKNRTNPKYIKEVGNVIINVCRIVPNGILVFFPSFQFLNDCLRIWKSQASNPTGKSSTAGLTVFERLGKRKEIFHEPTSKEIMEMNQKNSNQPRVSTHSRLSEIICDFEKAAEGQKGSILMSVCRGRLSEGLDFRDNKCRMVIVVGIPYPPKQDLRVQLKELYYEKLLSNKNEWYSRQASSAVNQAIGRVIRHRSDYGMILLLDARYTRRFHISKWIEPHKKVCNRFGDVTFTTSKFFQKWKKGLEETKEFQKAKRKDYEGGLGGNGGKQGMGSVRKIRLNLRKIELAYTTSQSLEDEDEGNQQQQQRQPRGDINMKENTSNFQPFQPLPPPPPQQQQPQQLQQQPSLFIGRSKPQQHQQNRSFMMNNNAPRQPPQQHFFQNNNNYYNNSEGRRRNRNNTSAPVRMNPNNAGPPPLPPKSSNSINNQQQQGQPQPHIGLIIPPLKLEPPNEKPPSLQHLKREILPPPPPNNNNTGHIEPPPPPPKPPKKEKKRRTRFLDSLREKLTNEEYGRFKGYILEIRNQTRDFELISSDVIDLIGVHGNQYCEMFLENLPSRKKEKFKMVWKGKKELGGEEESKKKKKKRKREEDKEVINLVEEDKEEISFEPPKKKRKLDEEGEIDNNSNQQNVILQQQQPHVQLQQQQQQQIINNNISVSSSNVYVFRKPPENKCMICKDDYKSPLTNPVCGHVACGGCWNELKNSGPSFRCPQCRKRVRNLHPVYF